MVSAGHPLYTCLIVIFFSLSAVSALETGMCARPMLDDREYESLCRDKWGHLLLPRGTAESRSSSEEITKFACEIARARRRSKIDYHHTHSSSRFDVNRSTDFSSSSRVKEKMRTFRDNDVDGNGAEKEKEKEKDASSLEQLVIDDSDQFIFLRIPKSGSSAMKFFLQCAMEVPLNDLHAKNIVFIQS